MIVFSWDDLKRLFTAKRRKIIRAGIICGLLALFISLLTPLHYEAIATFKQSSSRTDKSFDLKNLIQTFSSGSSEGNAIAIFLSDTVLEKVVQNVGLQAHLKKETHFERIKKNVLAELRILKQPQDASYFSSIIYTEETPLSLHLHRVSDTEFEIWDERKQLLEHGTIGKPLRTEQFQLTIKQMPPLDNTPFILEPLASATAALRKKITLKTAREDKNLLLIKCRDTQRRRSAEIANSLMEMYEKYLIEENQLIIGSQLSYLKVRQDELSVTLDQDIEAHATTLKQNLLSEGFLGIKDEMDFILEPLQTHQLRLDEIELELKQIDHRLKNVSPKPISSLVQRYSELLGQSAQKLLKQEEIDSLLSRQEFLQEEHLFIESIENDLSGISLDSARSLFDHYSRQFDDLHAQLKQIIFMRDHLFDPHFEISTLSNVLSDSVTQQMVQKSSSLEAELFDDLSHSAKDRHRLETTLSIHKQFLKSHLEQTLQLGKIRTELIKEKLSSLYTVMKTLLTQEKEALQERIAHLQKSMQTLPELWAYENRLKFKAELTKAMMEGLVNIAETKNLSHHLYQVESRPLDKAKPPGSFIAPRLLPKFTLIGTLGSLVFAFLFLIHSFFKGIDLSLTTAKELGAHTSGMLSLKSPLMLDSLEESDLETLRHIVSFLTEKKGIVATLGEKQTNFFPALTALLQKHQKSSCVIDCSFRTCSESKASSIFGIILADFRFKLRGLYRDNGYYPRNLNRKSAQKNPKIDRSLDFEQVPSKVASKEPGLLQVLHGDIPFLQHYPSYDFLPTGGSSSESVELLTSESFHTLTQKLSTQYDYLFLISRTSSDSLESDTLLCHSHSAIISLEKEILRQKNNKPITFIKYPTLVEA